MSSYPTLTRKIDLRKIFKKTKLLVSANRKKYIYWFAKIPFLKRIKKCPFRFFKLQVQLKSVILFWLKTQFWQHFLRLIFCIFSWPKHVRTLPHSHTHTHTLENTIDQGFSTVFKATFVEPCFQSLQVKMRHLNVCR